MGLFPPLPSQAIVTGRSPETEGGIVHPLPGPLVVLVAEANPGTLIIFGIPRLQEFLGAWEGMGASRGRFMNATHPMSAHSPLPPAEVFAAV